MTCPVAAVIVAYRSGSQLPACLAALRGKVEQAVVVDNTPGESPCSGVRAEFKWVTWIDNTSNRGFAAAVNQGIAATSAPYVLLLNPDCELLTDLGDLVGECGLEGVAGAGGLLSDPHGLPQVGFFARSLPTPAALIFEVFGVNRAWARNPVNRRYRLLDMDPGVAQEVQQPAGAFLLLRREALEAVGGLDEDFHPVWFEDVDLCRRLYDAGYSLRYTPAARARHVGAHAVETLAVQEMLTAWYGGLLRYAGKHYPRGWYHRVRCAVLVGLVLRMLYSYGRVGRSAESDAYGGLVRLVRSGFPGVSNKS